MHQQPSISVRTMEIRRRWSIRHRQSKVVGSMTNDPDQIEIYKNPISLISDRMSQIAYRFSYELDLIWGHWRAIGRLTCVDTSSAMEELHKSPCLFI